MLFPELHTNDRNSMKASGAFVLGLYRRIFRRPTRKVFVVGFHKTGTSSIGKALQMLGYRVCGSLKQGYDYSDQELPFTEYLISISEPLFKKFDAFQDTPWFLLYRELYDKYPDALFILSIREEESWLKSVQRHFANDYFPYHDYIYGTLDSLSEEFVYLDRYKKHNEEVRHFFSDKSGQLLEMDLQEEQDPWRILCKFLQVKQPTFSFPHANKGGSRGKLGRRFKKLLKKLYYSS